MGGKTNSVKTGSQKCKDEDTFINQNFNSLVEDPHVNEQAKESQDVFVEASREAAK